MKKQDYQLIRKLHWYFFRVLFVGAVVISFMFMTYYSFREKAVVVQSRRWMLDQSVTYADRIMTEIATLGDSIWNSEQIQGIEAANQHKRDYRYFRSCMDYLSNMESSAANIYRIRVFDMETKTLLTSRNGVYYDVEESSCRFYQRCLDTFEPFGWVTDFDDGIINTKADAQFVYFVRPVYARVTGEKTGIICIEVPQSVFSELMRQRENGDGFGMISEAVEISAASLVEDDMEHVRHGGKSAGMSHTFRANHRTYTAVYQRAPYSGWLFYLYYPSSHLSFEWGIFVIAVLLLCAIQIAAYAMIVRIFRHEVEVPMNLLLDTMSAFEQGDFGIQAERTKQDIFDEIFNHFNRMSKRTRALIDELIDQRLRVKESKLKMLQSQIKPHFLYNIFNNMLWMTQQQDYAGLETMIDAASGYYKTSLNFGLDEISLYDNRNQLKYYAQIQKIRFPSQFHCEIQFEEEILFMCIPNLLLQPLLENAITHGAANKERETRIHIHGYQQEDFAVLEFWDDGVGIEPERLEQLQAVLAQQDYQGDEFFALANVAERIRICYHGKGSITIDSRPGEWTRVVVRLPDEDGWFDDCAESV